MNEDTKTIKHILVYKQEVDLTSDDITKAWESLGRGLDKYTKFARAIISIYKEKINERTN